MVIPHHLSRIQWGRYDQHNHQIFSETTPSIYRNKQLDDRPTFIFSLRSPCMKFICFIRIKEQVGEQRSTVDTHGNTDLLLKNTFLKLNKYTCWGGFRGGRAGGIHRQFPLLFVFKQERSNHMFSMNESNDEKQSSIGRTVLTRTTRKYKHRKYRPISEMRNALKLNQ